MKKPPRQVDEKGRPVRRNTVAPTMARTMADPFGHRSPDHNFLRRAVDRTGGPWRGTSRIVDKAGRRKANKRSWKKLIAQARRAALAVEPEAD